MTRLKHELFVQAKCLTHVSAENFSSPEIHTTVFKTSAYTKYGICTCIFVVYCLRLNSFSCAEPCSSFGRFRTQVLSTVAFIRRHRRLVEFLSFLGMFASVFGLYNVQVGCLGINSDYVAGGAPVKSCIPTCRVLYHQ